MSKDKYPSIFSPQIEAIVFIILQIFYATRAVLKIGEYPRIFPSFSWGIFAQVTRLDQSCASENIWWIITNNYTPKWRQISNTFTDTEVNNCFSICHTRWITSGLKSIFINFVPHANWRRAISLFLGCSVVNSAWLIMSELANQQAKTAIHLCRVC